MPASSNDDCMKLIIIKIICTTLLLVKSTDAVCQKDSTVYFFDRDYNFCKQENLVYVGFGIKEKGRIKFSSYIDATGVRVIDGYFTDSTLAVKEGAFIFYDSGGNKESEGNYIKNKKEGYWLSWELGRVMDSAYYEDDEAIMETMFNYNTNGKLIRRMFRDPRKKIEDNTEWDENGFMSSNSHWINGTGDQINYYPDGRVKSIAHSSKGKLNSTKKYTEEGTLKTKKDLKKDNAIAEEKLDEMIKGMNEKAPSFPGGKDAFKVFMENHIQIPGNVMNNLNPNEQLTFSFSLNQDGKAYDVKVNAIGNFDMEAEVNRVLNLMPAWDMKGYKQYGPINCKVYLIDIKLLTHTN